jgi:hypothetical protein
MFKKKFDPELTRQCAKVKLFRRQGCQSYAPAALYSPEALFVCFWYSFLLEAE